jgi:nitric oxide reductase subunit C
LNAVDPVASATREAHTMAKGFTASAARNVFYGGTLFFLLLFIGLTVHTFQVLPQRDQRQQLSDPQVAAGKRIWEVNDCIGCHTLLGAGAYFAPELGNVYQRRGPEFIKAWIRIQPTHVPGRRQMPQFNLTDEQINDLVAYLKYVSEINTSHWPPNIQG